MADKFGSKSDSSDFYWGGAPKSVGVITIVNNLFRVFPFIKIPVKDVIMTSYFQILTNSLFTCNCTSPRSIVSVNDKVSAPIAEYISWFTIWSVLR